MFQFNLVINSLTGELIHPTNMSVDQLQEVDKQSSHPKNHKIKMHLQIYETDEEEVVKQFKNDKSMSEDQIRALGFKEFVLEGVTPEVQKTLPIGRQCQV